MSSNEEMVLKELAKKMLENGYNFNSRFDPENLKKHRLDDESKHIIEKLRDYKLNYVSEIGDLVRPNVDLRHLKENTYDTFEDKSKSRYEVILLPRKAFEVKDENSNELIYKATFFDQLTLCNSGYDPEVLIGVDYKPLGFEIKEGLNLKISNSLLKLGRLYESLINFDLENSLSYEPKNQLKQGVDVLLRPGKYFDVKHNALNDYFIVNSTDSTNMSLSDKERNFFKSSQFQRCGSLEKVLNKDIEVIPTYYGSPDNFVKRIKNSGDYNVRLTILPRTQKEGRVL